MKIIGIYQITNKKNNKRYIGSSLDIKKRFTTHKRLLNQNKHHCIHLQNAWNKYGEKSFEFKIIKKCDIKDKLKLEQWYLNNHKPEYNISLSSIAPMTGRKHSKKTLRKLKKRPKVQGKDHYRYGKKWTKQDRKKLLESRKGFKHSEKTKRKMRKTAIRLNRYKDIKGTRDKKIKDSNGKIFKSLTKAAKFHKISIPGVCDILKGRTKQTKKGIKFYYV